ncbi:MAG: SMI1/KNR4 family protein [Planctomycetaceae bacterium]
MDYTAWTKRASDFLRNLATLPGTIDVEDGIQPANASQYISDWLASDRCSAPPEVKAFLSAASGRCFFFYRWLPPQHLESEIEALLPGHREIAGGGDLCDPSPLNLYDSRFWFRDVIIPQIGTATERQFQMTEQAKEFMKRSIIENVGLNDPDRSTGRIVIMKLDDGEKIAIEAEPRDSTRAILLIHADDPARRHVISHSFDDFLAVWEQLSYLPPTLDNLAPWLDPTTGQLVPSRDLCRVKRLRELLMTTGSSSISTTATVCPTGKYADYLQRSERFARSVSRLPGQWGIDISVSPPVTEAEADELEKSIPFGLPAPLREFYTQSASACRLHWNWTPPLSTIQELKSVFEFETSLFGGFEFVPWPELYEHHQIHRWWDSVKENPSQEDIKMYQPWRNVIPFIRVLNGDVIALRVDDDLQIVSVDYFDHENYDNPVIVISPSFEQFMADWEKLFYLGPEIWLLRPFLSHQGGGPLDVDSPAVDIWRKAILSQG